MKNNFNRFGYISHTLMIQNVFKLKKLNSKHDRCHSTCYKSYKNGWIVVHINIYSYMHWFVFMNQNDTSHLIYGKPPPPLKTLNKKRNEITKEIIHWRIQGGGVLSQCRLCTILRCRGKWSNGRFWDEWFPASDWRHGRMSNSN